MFGDITIKSENTCDSYIFISSIIHLLSVFVPFEQDESVKHRERPAVGEELSTGTGFLSVQTHTASVRGRVSTVIDTGQC